MRLRQTQLAALNHSDQLLDGNFSFGHNLGIQYPG
jgi:hypothetical protein